MVDPIDSVVNKNMKNSILVRHCVAHSFEERLKATRCIAQGIERVVYCL